MSFVSRLFAGAPRRSPRPVRRQVAALCHRIREGRREVLLITSRERGRWIVPKGWPMKGLDDHEAAAVEAWEEAGVRDANVTAEPLGAFGYDKRVTGGADIAVEAEVYGMEVVTLEREFPEASERKREWVTPEEAARRVDEPELRALLTDFARG